MDFVDARMNYLTSPPLVPPPPPAAAVARRQFQPMDSPVLNQLFRQLFQHPACRSLRASSALSGRRPGCVRLSNPSRQQCRSFFGRRQGTKKSLDSGVVWNQRKHLNRDLQDEFQTHPLVTAKELRNHRERPRQVKMLTREFIDGKPPIDRGIDSR